MERQVRGLLDCGRVREGESRRDEGRGQPGSRSRGLCRTLHFIFPEYDGRAWKERGSPGSLKEPQGCCGS